MTTKSKPTSPRISVAWLVGTLRKVPTRLSPATIRCLNDAAECMGVVLRLCGRSRLRHRVIGSVQDPAGLLGKVHARRAEDVDKLIEVLADRLGGVNRGRRDHR